MISARYRAAIAATAGLLIGAGSSYAYFGVPNAWWHKPPDQGFAQGDVDTRLIKLEDQLDAQSRRIGTLEEASEQAAKAPNRPVGEQMNGDLLRRLKAVETKADATSEKVYDLCYIRGLC